MPVDREHAFGDGAVFARPSAMMPRLPWSEAGRAARAWMRFDAAAKLGDGCRLGPRAWCVNGSGDPARIVLGPRVVCRGLLRVENFGAGRIEIGADSYIGDDCLLSASCGISIGDGVLMAHGVQLFDNDSHPLDAAARAADFAAVLCGGRRGSIASAPIRVGARAWIGFGAIVLKGVAIGEDSVVAAGSVVTRDVPAGTIAGGNPARVLKSLDDVPL